LISQALSNEISNRASADNVVSAQAASAISQLNSVVSQLASATSNKDSALSQAISAGDAGLSVRIDTVSNKVSAICAISVKSAGGTSVQGLQSVVNTLSAKIASIGGTSTGSNYASIASHMASVASQAASVASHMASVASQAASVASQAASVAVATNPVQALLLADASVSAGTLTDVSGLSVAMSVSVIYKLEIELLYSTSVGQLIGFGMTFPAMLRAGGHGVAPSSAIPDANNSVIHGRFAPWGDAGSGSVIVSVAAPGTNYGSKNVKITGIMSPSADGALQVQAKASSGTGTIIIHRGSYIRLYRLGGP
jgi:hypothetical protein